MNITIHPCYAPDGSLQDIVAEVNNRQLAMLGHGGAQREQAILEGIPSFEACLPVLVGSGMGYALQTLLARTTGAVAVVDKECALLELTKLQEQYPDPRIIWITDANPERVLATLTHWQQAHGNLPLRPVIHPFYMRLERDWYQNIRAGLEASSRFDFWSKAIQPRFASTTPRVLLITSQYFLMGELAEACEQAGIPHLLLHLENDSLGGAAFVERLLKAVLAFRPDCVLTMNHLGLDREGVLMDLLARLRLPLASWFVDNPQLILHNYTNLASPWVTLFTWDKDNIPALHAQGYEHVYYMPLGTSPRRFHPKKPHDRPCSSLFPTAISFVGNSMVYKVGHRMRAGKFSKALLRGYRDLAARYRLSEERSMQRFLQNCPEPVAAAYKALPSNEDRLAYETMLTWEATRQYRTQCVAQILPLHPVLVGDKGWFITLDKHAQWRHHPEVSYYDTLPSVYQFSTINFNCTSQQMKGAVNQRIFDVPAAGSFVLTDWREQMDDLFEPKKEILCYREPEEALDLARYYLKHAKQRHTIVLAARQRVLNDHAWEHRIVAMLEIMKTIYR